MFDKDVIIKLISSKCEGGYWDFKKQWYKNNDDMLFDIICFSNNLENRDCYIIIGVDESDNYSINDITGDPNRKTNAQLISFLKSIPFCGDIRPNVKVETLEIENKIIDIIVIKNSYMTPFFLRETYKHGKCVYPYIFTRVKDTNSPRDSNADINHIELLWKKRFRLDETPIEKLKYYLLDFENWIDSENNSNLIKYYKNKPEFIIEELPDDRKGLEVYHLLQYDYEPHWGIINVKYNQTILDSILMIILDGGRYSTACPSSGTIAINHKKYYYHYFDKTQLNYNLYEFYNLIGTKDHYQQDRLEECLLFFNNNEEKKLFEEYILSNTEEFIDKVKKYKNEFNHIKLEGFNMSEFERRYKTVKALQEMFVDFKTK